MRPRLDDPAFLERRLINERLYAAAIERKLADFVPSSSDVGPMQLAERDRLLASLHDKAIAPLLTLSTDGGGDAAALRRRLDAIRAEILRVDQALERIPSLGLVTERGGS